MYKSGNGFPSSKKDDSPDRSGEIFSSGTVQEVKGLAQGFVSLGGEFPSGQISQAFLRTIRSFLISQWRFLQSLEKKFLVTRVFWQDLQWCLQL